MSFRTWPQGTSSLSPLVWMNVSHLLEVEYADVLDFPPDTVA